MVKELDKTFGFWVNVFVSYIDKEILFQLQTLVTHYSKIKEKIYNN